MPHRLNVSGTCVLPFGEGHRWLTRGVANALLGGWSVSAAGRYQNGFPISVWQSSNNSGLLGSNQRPNIVDGVALATSGSTEDRLGGWINAAAFTRRACVHVRQCAADAADLRTPGQKNTDISISEVAACRRQDGARCGPTS